MESDSWVTRSTDAPPSLIERMISMTVREFSESRSDVGSSATTSFGSFISALAMDTRRCSPPESCLGRASARSSTPMRPSRPRAFPSSAWVFPILPGSSTFSRTVRLWTSPCPWGT